MKKRKRRTKIEKDTQTQEDCIARAPIVYESGVWCIFQQRHRRCIQTPRQDVSSDATPSRGKWLPRLTLRTPEMAASLIEGSDCPSSERLARCRTH